MFFVILFVLFAAGYSCLLIFTTGLFGGFIALWIALGILASILTVALFAVSFIEIGAHTSPKSNFKVYILRNATWLFIVFYHIHITSEGLENVPKGSPFVVYSNHKSNMDPVVIYNQLNRQVGAIGKKSLFSFWPMNHICKCFGAISMDRDNDREAAKNLIQAIKAVKDGFPMIIFPEGGIKNRDSEEMSNLRAGAYKLAMKANAPIIPTCIIGSSEISKKKRYQRKDIHIIFHPAITKEEYTGKTTTEVGLIVENLINEDIRKYEEK